MAAGLTHRWTRACSFSGSRILSSLRQIDRRQSN
jgi:hypothetical protein